MRSRPTAPSRPSAPPRGPLATTPPWPRNSSASGPRSVRSSLRSSDETWLSTVRTEMRWRPPISRRGAHRRARLETAAYQTRTLDHPIVRSVDPMKTDTTSKEAHHDHHGNPVRNGVDTAGLFATLDAVKANPEIARFQFRASNEWISGTNNRHDQRLLRRRPGGRTNSRGARRRPSRGAGRPGPGADPGGVPAARPGGLPDLGPGQHRRGARRHTDLVTRRSKATSTCSASLACPTRCATDSSRSRSLSRCPGDDPEKLRKVVEQSRQRSAVFDVITNSVPVTIEVNAG